MPTGNSILDEVGDVVLYHGHDGDHLFRDDRSNGLLVTWTGNGQWTLTRETHTRTRTGTGDEESWVLVPDAEPDLRGRPRPGQARRVRRPAPSVRSSDPPLGHAVRTAGPRRPLLPAQDSLRGRPMMFTLAEIRLLIEALDTLILEYDETPERTELVARLKAERDRRSAEVEFESGRYS